VYQISLEFVSLPPCQFTPPLFAVDCFSAQDFNEERKIKKGNAQGGDLPPIAM